MTTSGDVKGAGTTLYVKRCAFTDRAKALTGEGVATTLLLYKNGMRPSKSKLDHWISQPFYFSKELCALYTLFPVFLSSCSPAPSYIQILLLLPNTHSRASSLCCKSRKCRGMILKKKLKNSVVFSSIKLFI